MRNAIKKNLPGVPLLRCWNHLWGSVERWILSKGGKADDIGFYTDSLRELLLQPTKEAFEEQLINKKNGYINRNGYSIPAWSTEFYKYYEEHISPDISGLAAYAIKPLCKNLFNNFTGITTNASEG
jgi:hypothetical protein